MATIALNGVSHSYDIDAVRDVPATEPTTGRFVIRDLNITWQDGSANALLGPSGCGKTTMLNIISGLLRPTLGAIELDGRDVTDMPTEKRQIAQVFQFPVVYDTMSVYSNLAFPLRNAGITRTEVARRVTEIAELLELGRVLKMAAGRISQAEKQKVSLGRGIVRKDTVAILLDEPLTVIDPKEKYILRRKLREVQRRLKITMIYVTHDQHEALTFADQVTVVKDGEVVQTGSPNDLHAEPSSPFIGYFIGSPGMNLLDCQLEDRGLQFGDFSLPLSNALFDTLTNRLPPRDGRFTFGIRPEFVRPVTPDTPGAVPLTVTLIERMGAFKVLNLATGDTRLKSRVSDQVPTGESAKMWFCFPEEKMKLFRNDRRIH